MLKNSVRRSMLTGRLAGFGMGLLVLACGGLYAAPGPVSGSAGQIGKCSIPNGEIIKIASWNINKLLYQRRREAGAFETFVAMLGRIDADVIAFQGVTPAGDEIVELASALQEGKRCYHTLVSAEADGEKYAVLYDLDAVELLYPKGPVASCDGSASSGMNGQSPLMLQAPGSAGDAKPSQLAYFRAQGTGQTRDSRFDFALINVHVDGADLDQLVADFDSLDQNYPWLAGEQDRIIIGHLGIGATPGQLRGNYFPQMKPLINPLLIISLGLSDMTFDEAVGRMSSPANRAGRPSEHYDNILVHRWDRPGTCSTALYCGGLEEFVNARVYRHDKLFVDAREDFDVAFSDENPISARFCKYADTDSFTEVGP